jgi:hyperosmotically inducible protein
MKRKILFLFLIVLVSSFVACKSNNDAKITAEAKIMITDDNRLDAAKIDVDTKDGVVTLHGKVLGKAEENRAIEIVRAVPGVISVVSKLEVENKIGNSEIEERVEENEKVAEEKREEAKGHETISEAVDDSSITTKVKFEFAKDPTVRAYKIDVDTQKGVVTLSGTVKDEKEALQAIKVAESVKGVKHVNSVLTVGS